MNLSFISVIVVPLPKEKSCLTSKRMNIAEVKTIAKSLPLLRLNTYKSLILSYSEPISMIFLKKKCSLLKIE